MNEMEGATISNGLIERLTWFNLPIPSKFVCYHSIVLSIYGSLQVNSTFEVGYEAGTSPVKVLIFFKLY